LIKRKIDREEKHKIDKNKNIKYKKKIEKIEGSNLKKSLNNLIDVFNDNG